MSVTYKDFEKWTEGDQFARDFLEKKRQAKEQGKNLELVAKHEGPEAGWYARHIPSGKESRISNFYSPDEEEAMISCFEGDNHELLRLYFPELI